MTQNLPNLDEVWVTNDQILFLGVFAAFGVAALFWKIVTVTEQLVVFQRVLHRPIV